VSWRREKNSLRLVSVNSSENGLSARKEGGADAHRRSRCNFGRDALHGRGSDA
jgi:hypothetical protein